MAEVVLADSGAIVAALDKRDQNHAWARRRLDGFTKPCVTCEGAISESFFLLAHLRYGKEALCRLLERQVIQVDFSFPAHRMDVLRPMERYADTPMSFTDACIVRMSEIHRRSRVFTTDGDFIVYRRFGREAIPVIAPW